MGVKVVAAIVAVAAVGVAGFKFLKNKNKWWIKIQIRIMKGDHNSWISK